MQLWTIGVKDLRIEASIGINPCEMEKEQPILISFDCSYNAPTPVNQENYDDYLCYDRLSKGIEKLANGRHIYLLETLAAEIIDLLMVDDRVTRSSVTIKKPMAVESAEHAYVSLEQVR